MNPNSFSPAAAVITPSCQAARLLRGRFDTEDDPSGYAAYNAARVISPLSTKTRNGNTPEAAESTSNAAFIGEFACSTKVVGSAVAVAVAVQYRKHEQQQLSNHQ
jgi:hypothetical protein